MTNNMPSIASLPKRKQKYVKARIRGLNKQSAALRAGYAPSSANVTSRIETPDVKAVFASLVHAKAPPDRVAQVIADGLSAEKTEFFAKDGVVIDSRTTIAWNERRAYAELAAEYGGYVAKEESRHLHLHALGSLTPVTPIDVSPVAQPGPGPGPASPVE